MKITKSQLKNIISEEVNNFLEEAHARYRPVNTPEDAHLTDKGKRMRDLSYGKIAIGPRPTTTMSAKTPKPKKEKELPDDHGGRIGPPGMAFKFEEESTNNESKNIIVAFQQLLAQEDVQAEILKVLEDKLKDIDLTTLFSSESSDLSALSEKRRK